jgi:hypothetical protein
MKTIFVNLILCVVVLATVTAYAYKGHQTNNHYSYRLYHAQNYRILDSTEFFLYYRYEQQEHIKGKELLKTDCYFFSKDAGSQIQPLTIGNLKAAFPDNNRFHYLLDAEFHQDSELMSYDSYAKMYKIKYLYSVSIK